MLAEMTALGIALAVAVAAAIHYRRRATRQAGEIETLKRAIVRDPLTGLLNRRGFQERMEVELSRAERDGTPLSLVVADLDRFKELNDSLGHLGGDMALERIAGVIGKTVRRADAAARLGGDEFAFILPNTRGFQARIFAERLRTTTERSFGGTAAELTMSLGIASFPADANSSETLLKAADHAMYEAKSLGRNRTALRVLEPLEAPLALASPARL
jgi:diguanylate cyclase (GGDEF)-like protein